MERWVSKQKNLYVLKGKMVQNNMFTEVCFSDVSLTGV